MVLPKQLDDLRQEIDRVDDAMHDLVMRRAAIVEEIGALKGKTGGPLMRPGREALILRRLAARHSGAFPFAVIARLWREMISTLLRLQGPFNLAIFVPDDEQEASKFRAIAREQYGHNTPMLACHSYGQVLKLVSEGKAAAGILPLPTHDEAQPWWPTLVSGSNAPRVVARLPFVADAPERRTGIEAMVVAAMERDVTEDDLTLLVIDASREISRGRIRSALEAVGLPPDNLAIARDTGPDASMHLLEIKGPVTANDPRLAEFLKKTDPHIRRIIDIGGYARPLVAPLPRNLKSEQVAS
jgi:chorismate mutase/prephenate dehydratase